MKVILAEVLGYCMGVRRAVESAEKALEEYSRKKVYSLGPLIHNKTTLDYLSSKGLQIIGENDFLQVEDESVVIIRAHGVGPEILKILEEKKCTVINATCPRVVASQKNAAKYSSMGYKVILAGDKNHGEVTGIEGYAGKNFMLIQNSPDAENFPVFNEEEKAVFLSQTTFSPAEFEKISQILLQKIPSLKIMNTICSATFERQKALENLCSQVDGVLVAGGKNSANSRRLLQTAERYCRHACLIENASEIPEEFFSLETVGLTAGASTPDSVIQEVKNRLERL